MMKLFTIITLMILLGSNAIFSMDQQALLAREERQISTYAYLLHPYKESPYKKNVDAGNWIYSDACALPQAAKQYIDTFKKTSLTEEINKDKAKVAHDFQQTYNWFKEHQMSPKLNIFGMGSILHGIGLILDMNWSLILYSKYSSMHSESYDIVENMALGVIGGSSLLAHCGASILQAHEMVRLRQIKKLSNFLKEHAKIYNITIKE